MNKIESPCVRNCYLDENEVCTGCLRSLDEIKAWGQASDALKTEVIERINGDKQAPK